MSRWLVTALGMVVALGLSTTAYAQGKGADLYTAQKCNLCHSIDGKGNAKGVLDGVGTKYAGKEADLREWFTDPVAAAAKAKAERKPVMKSYKALPKEDIDALIAYMMSLKKK